MTLKTKTKKKVKIMGKSYKVEEPVSETLKAMSEALRSHEVALLTWVHKDYNAYDKFEEEEVKGFRKSLYEYCLQIPESASILKRMSELDDQIEADNQNQQEKVQNKEEKDSGAKD